MCDHLGIESIATARKWITTGYGPPTFKVRKHRRVRKFAVLKWVFDQEQKEFE
jgi:hypothetical protein